MFRSSLQILSETFLILRRNERGMIKNVYWPSSKVPVTLVRLQLSLNFIDRFSEIPQIANFMKIRPVGVEVFHADGQTYRQKDGRKDGQTDMTKLIAFFSQFCKRA
jgi:hypothetical protein